MNKADHYCPECHDLIPQAGDPVCPTCGYVMKQNPHLSGHTHLDQMDETGSTFLWSLLGFLIPVLGILLYFLMRDTNLKAADSTKQGAILGFMVFIPALLLFLVL